jgi:glycosyltransferase involved in cell wall biosynthesis
VRILQIIHAFPPYSEAGSENYTYALSQALRRLGHEVAVFHRVADPAQEEYALTAGEVTGLPVYRLNNTFRYCDRFEKTYRNADIDARFGAVLDRFRPEVVHFHHLTCLSTSCVFEAKRRGLPVVMTLHDYWLICQRGQFLKRDVSLCSGQEDGECVRCLAHQLSISGGSAWVSKIDRKIMPSPPYFRGGLAEIRRRLYGRFSRLFFQRQARALAEVRTRMAHVREVCAAVDLFISPSQFLQEQFLAFGLPADKVLFSPYGHEGSAFPDVAQAALLSGRPLRFAFTGTVIPPKGVHLLIEAFRTIPASAARLTIYGGEVPYEGFPEYGKTLRELAAGCNHIVFAGPYRPTEVGRLLQEVDVLVVPSIWYENAPLTIQEAFLAKVPVITADLGGMREFVQDGVNGLLFRPRDAADLREKIRRMIDHPALIEQLSKGAPAVKTIIEDAVTMANRYEKLSAIKGER